VDSRCWAASDDIEMKRCSIACKEAAFSDSVLHHECKLQPYCAGFKKRENIYFGLQETSSIAKQCRELEAGVMNDVSSE
jgi:hypothetical protein